MQTGTIEEAIPLEEQAIRLSPRDPDIFNRYLVIGQVHLLQSRTEDAIVWLEKARSANSASPYPHTWLASAYGLKDYLEALSQESGSSEAEGRLTCAMAQLSYRRHRFPADIIQHAIWLYLRFTLSYRDVEELLAERGLDVSYETVRRWVLKFGPLIAAS
jgi:tetratricopeptide (TPR) repeat protein